jgi:hypothetical protein
MVGLNEEADESQSFAAACYVHNLFRGGMRLKEVHIVRQNTPSRPLLARSQRFNKTCEKHQGGYAHLCPLEDLRATNIEI